MHAVAALNSVGPAAEPIKELPSVPEEPVMAEPAADVTADHDAVPQEPTRVAAPSRSKDEPIENVSMSNAATPKNAGCCACAQSS